MIWSSFFNAYYIPLFHNAIYPNLNFIIPGVELGLLCRYVHRDP
jgi:hypothetical protein